MSIRSYSDLEYARQNKLAALFDGYAEVGRMLNGLLANLEKKLFPESRILNPESSTEQAT